MENDIWVQRVLYLTSQAMDAVLLAAGLVIIGVLGSLLILTIGVITVKFVRWLYCTLFTKHFA
jgi:hypothetical protein